jgi:hypothetical protein
MFVINESAQGVDCGYLMLTSPASPGGPKTFLAFFWLPPYGNAEDLLSAALKSACHLIVTFASASRKMSNG